VGSGQDTPITRYDKIKRNYWTNSGLFGMWRIICSMKSWSAALKRQHVDEIVWKADTLADPSSTTDVSCRHWIISRFIQDSSVGLPNETLEETEPGQGHVTRHRFACPSPNIKRPRSCLPESQQMAATTNPRGGATGGRSSVEKYGGRDEEDSKPSLVNSSSVLVASYPPDQEAALKSRRSTHTL
jgi:hypothetical protein